jgi:hypothetical protein
VDRVPYVMQVNSDKSLQLVPSRSAHVWVVCWPRKSTVEQHPSAPHGMIGQGWG